MILILVASVLLSRFHTCHGFQFTEATIKHLQTGFDRNELTSEQLVEFYLKEIARLNPLLKGVIEINPDAVHQAKKADEERRKAKAAISSSSFSPLHGIPILLKDNIATKDKLNTTAGSLALVGSIVPRDAGVAEKLRRAGAIILGKASMSEWAHFRSDRAPSGWSARGGQGKVFLVFNKINFLIYYRYKLKELQLELSMTHLVSLI